LLDAVNARRVHRCAPPARPARPSGIDGISAPRRRGIYVMTGTDPAGGKRQDGAA
jgi:hypothetical protein